MNETNTLAERLKLAKDNRDLSMIADILAGISSGHLVPDSPYEKQSLEVCINSIMGMLRSGTKGWNRSGGIKKEDVLDACDRALAGIKGEEFQPKKEDQAAFRGKRQTGPLKRIPSVERNFPSGEFNAVRIKRR